MITEHDLQEAIAECEGQRNPNSNVCVKLAAFYIIRDHLYPNNEAKKMDFITSNTMYSGSAGPDFKLNTDTEFADVVNSADLQEVMIVMDELMTTLKAIHPRLYNSVISKLHP